MQSADAAGSLVDAYIDAYYTFSFNSLPQHKNKLSIRESQIGSIGDQSHAGQKFAIAAAS